MLDLQIKHSGSATFGNFIDHDTVLKLQLPIQPLQYTLKIKAIDGGLIGTGIVTLCAKPLTLQVSPLHYPPSAFSYKLSISFLITTKHLIILGFTLMQQPDPKISLLGQRNHKMVQTKFTALSAIPQCQCCIHHCGES